MQSDGRARGGSRRLPALHPPAAAIFPALSLYSANAYQLPPSAALPSVALLLAVCAIGWGALYAWLRDNDRAALLASAGALLFWAVEPISSALGSLVGAAAPAAAFVIAALLLGFAGLCRFLHASPRWFASATPALNAIALAGIAIPVAYSLPGLAAQPGRGPSLEPFETKLAAGSAKKPDIYVIVLDAYGRADHLEEHFGFRNGLAEALSDLGFYVAKKSVANYNHTATSIPSMLNFDYIQKLAPDGEIIKLNRLVRRNRVVELLRPLGYRFIACATGYGITECNITADRYLEPPAPWGVFGVPIQPSEFDRQLIDQTPFEPFLRGSRVSPYAIHRERILHCLDALPEIASDPAPTFTFAHILAPHEPFVFGAAGEDVSPYGQPFNLSRIFVDEDLPEESGRVGPEYARRYREQARFITRRVAAVVDEILTRSPSEPIIIVQGDHGPYGFTPDLRRAKFPILNAYHLPGKQGKRVLYPRITPVNSFRLVLDHYFRAGLERLPDESWVDHPDRRGSLFEKATEHMLE